MNTSDLAVKLLMTIKNYVYSFLFSLLISILALSSLYCQAQEPSLSIRFKLDSVFVDALKKDSFAEIHFFIKDTGKMRDGDDKGIEYMRFSKHTKNIELYKPSGVYDIGFSLTILFKVPGLEGFCFAETVYDSVFSGISVRSGKPTHLNLFLKNNCPYRRDPSNNVCPKCHMVDSVIVICKGLPAIDYDCHWDSNYSHCSPPACAPTWYCKRDDMEF